MPFELVCCPSIECLIINRALPTAIVTPNKKNVANKYMQNRPINYTEKQDLLPGSTKIPLGFTTKRNTYAPRFPCTHPVQL